MENKFRKEQEELKQKMEKEAKDRESKEKELNQRMEKSKESGRNEVIELFEKVRRELADRKKENEELRNLLNEENLQRMKEANLKVLIAGLSRQKSIANNVIKRHVLSTPLPLFKRAKCIG